MFAARVIQNKILLRTIFFLCLTPFFLRAQNSAHDSLITLAKAAYEQKTFGEAGQLYLHAFKSLGYRGFPDDRFQAAKALAQSNQPDSALMNLFKLYEKTDFVDHSLLANEPMFAPLKSHPRWQTLMTLLAPSMPDLAKKLLDIHDLDQKNRKQLDPVSKQYGYYSDEYKALWKIINHDDSINLIHVLQIIDQHGWLGRQKIGVKGNKTLFLVIQHSNLATQEKYLPAMQAAAEKGDAKKSDLAMLEDRVRLGQGKKQWYGTQMTTNYDTGEKDYRPIEDIDNLNNRRQTMGLFPFSEEQIERLKTQGKK